MKKSGHLHTMAFFAALLLLFLTAEAAFALDPRLDWQTAETEHFSIHFHQGIENFARRAAAYAEEAHRLLIPLMDAAESQPKEKIQVVIGDTTDSANGSATVYPRALIRLNPIPPEGHSELSDTEDWLWTLLVHELTHILHMSDVRGLPGVVNRVLGRRWIPNSIQPNWLVEGFAIQSETRLSTGGRNRSSLYDMKLRLMALEDAFPDLDDVSGSPAVWPRGVVPYLCGARFVDFVVRENGPDTVARLSHDHASMILPLWRNVSQASVVQKSWPRLFEDWRRSEEERARAVLDKLRDQGLTEPHVVTHSGERTGSPKFCRPDGHEERLCFIDAPGTRRPSIRSVPLKSPHEDGGGGGESDTRQHGELLTTGELTVSPDGWEAVVSQTVTFETDYSVGELYAVNLKTGSRRRLTEGARASDPAFSPDGKRVFFIQRLRGGGEALSALEIPSGEIRVLLTVPLGESISSPAPSPDGRGVFLSHHGLMGRAIERFDLEKQTLTSLTAHDVPRAMRIDPAVSPDGASLVYSSDQGGIYDLFRVPLTADGGAAGAEERLSRVISGAFSPAFSSDGRFLAFEVHSSRGSDAALMLLSELPSLETGEVLDRNRGEPSAFLRAFHSGNTHSTSAASAPVEIHAYRAADSVGAWTWMPELESDADGRTLGFSTFGEDAVGRHAWSLDAGLGITSHQPYVSASYTYRGIRPSLTAGVSSYYGRGYWASWFPERQWSAYAGASYPVAGANYAMSFSLSASATLHQALGRYAASAASPRPVHPESVLTTQLRAGAAWSNAWTPPQGISPSEGWTLSASGTLSARALGSDRDYAALSMSISRYLAMPWHDLHALALRLRGGIGWSERQGDGLFSLGGASVRNPITDYIDDQSMGTTALRGYRGFAAAGDWFAMASAEYRLPIATLDGGIWTLPVYLRRLHGALTCDVGYVGWLSPMSGVRDSGFLPSVGAVLRLEVLVAYDTLTQIQAGYAYGFGREGIHNIYLGLGAGF